MVYKHSHGWHSWIFDVYMSNPVTVAVEMFHRAFWSPIVPAGEPQSLWPPQFAMYTIAGIAATLVIIIFGQFVFRRFERTFAQDL
jgi:ABC-2 type transport system permease protein